MTPGQRQSAQVRFAFNEPIALIGSAQESLDFALRVAGAAPACSSPESLRILAAPIYRLNAVLSLLWGSTAIGALFTLLWERVRKWLEYM